MAKRGGNHSEQHTHLKNKVLLALGCREDVLVWNNPSGVFRAMDSDRIVRAGIAGQPDILSVVEVEITPDMVGRKVGVLWGIEIKTGVGRLSEKQLNWKTSLDKRSGFYTEARSVEDVISGLKRVLAGLHP